MELERLSTPQYATAATDFVTQSAAMDTDCEDKTMEPIPKRMKTMPMEDVTESAIVDADCKATDTDANKDVMADERVDLAPQAADDAMADEATELAQCFPDFDLEVLKELIASAGGVEQAAAIAAMGPDAACAHLRARSVDADQLAAHAKAAKVPVHCAMEMAAGQIGAAAAVMQFPHLAQHLSASALAVLVAAEGGGVEGYRAAATLALRHKVWQCRNKEKVYHSYTREKSEAALRRWELPPAVAEKCGLPREAGYTWLDAVEHKRNVALQEAESAGRAPPSPGELYSWKNMGCLPMFSYLQSRCQHCGSQSGNTTVEAPQTEDEKNPRFNLEGRVYVLHCSKCGQKSRWWRSQAPEVMLNPNNWGRRCGECADMATWFAGYLGVGLRYVISVDNDHIWTEWWNDATGQFKQGGVHGNGWTDIVAIGSSLPGTGPGCEMASEQVTERYLNTWPADHPVRERVLDRRTDATGQKTQLKTVIGYACMRGELDAAGVTAVLRAAQRDYDAGVEVCDLSREHRGEARTSVEQNARQLQEAFGINNTKARNALHIVGGDVERAAALLLGSEM